MHAPTPGRLTALVVVGIVTVQALMVFAFAWPAANVGPRELPVAVAGPPQAVEQIEATLAAVPGPDGGETAFDVVVVDDGAAATAAIEDREVYGAVVVSPDGPRLLVASAAGPAVAQMLRTAAAELSPPGAAVPVEDVVPTDPDDPVGAGLGAALLPLVMTSVAGGIVAGFVLRSTRYRLAAITGIAVLGGLVLAAVLQYPLSILSGSYLDVAGVLALLIAAVSAAMAGLVAVLGRTGAILGVLTMIFIGNPLSAAASAAEMLPQPWGALGQLLPPGAGVSATRSIAFFDGAAAAQPLTVLAVWLVAGLALLVLGGLIRSRSDAEAEPSPLEMSATRSE
jgi:hypothetical protein